MRNPENAERVCALLADRYTLRQIARELGVDASSITHWSRDDEDFGQRYARAMELRYLAMAEEIIEISDDGTNDWAEREQDGRSITVVDHEHIQRSKLRVDARKWILSKMVPRQFGDRVVNEITGKDGKDLMPAETDPTRLALAVLNLLEAAKKDQE